MVCNRMENLSRVVEGLWGLLFFVTVVVAALFENGTINDRRWGVMNEAANRRRRFDFVCEIQRCVDAK